MTTHNFSIKEILNSSWSKTKEHAWYLFCVFVLVGIVMGATKFIPIFSMIFSLLAGIAVITVSLVIVRNEIPTFYDLVKSFRSYKIFWHYFLASILYALIVLVGLILVILPGIYLIIRLQFYKFLVVDNENIKVTEALKKSMEMTKGHFWKLFGFSLLLIVINIIGAIPFGLGLIITIPVTVLAGAFLYKKLLPVHQATLIS